MSPEPTRMRLQRQHASSNMQGGGILLDEHARPVHEHERDTSVMGCEQSVLDCECSIRDGM